MSTDRVMARHSVTPEKKAAFIANLHAGCSVSAAAASVGVSREHMYRLRKADEALRAAWDDAIECGTDVLESEAHRRAIAGSDTLLMFLLKARRPEKYREGYKVAGGDKPIEIVVTRRMVEPGEP